MADAFGQMLLGGTGLEIIERDDRFLDAVKMVYFAPVSRVACGGASRTPLGARPGA